jgi:RNA polymerase sigma-70 factor, ECF subfamily
VKDRADALPLESDLEVTRCQNDAAGGRMRDTPRLEPESEMHYDDLVAEHVPMLLQVAKRYCRNLDEAQDLVQVTVEYVLRRRDKLNGPNHVLATLLTVLKHRFYDYCRRAKPVAVEEGELTKLASPPEQEEERPWEKIHMTMLQEAIEQLPDKLRRVYRMQVLEGYKLREIAKALEIPLGTVGTLLMRARESLKKILTRQL